MPSIHFVYRGNEFFRCKNIFPTYRRRREAKRMLKVKLELAKQRKESLRREMLKAKNIEAIEHFREHWMFREQVFLKNIELLELYEETHQKNIEVIFNSTGIFSNFPNGNLTM